MVVVAMVAVMEMAAVAMARAAVERLLMPQHPLLLYLVPHH